VIERIIAAAEEAGRIIEGIRARGFDTLEKGDMSPVTQADEASDAYLKEVLLGILPCGWLSEETADSPERFKEKRLWVVDPMDGTREFIKGIPEYAVAIGLAEEGRAILGVIHNPRNGETLWARRGEGAWLDGRRLQVQETRVLLASRSEIARGEFTSFSGLFDVECVGSIAWKMACVAAGRGGLTLSRGPKWEWDVCAGQVLVEEAGGIATDVFGAPLAYNKSFPKVKGILAGAPEACARAAALIRNIGASDRMDEFDHPRE